MFLAYLWILSATTTKFRSYSPTRATSIEVLTATILTWLEIDSIKDVGELVSFSFSSKVLYTII